LNLHFKKYLGLLIRYGLGIGILIYFFEKSDFHWDALKTLLEPKTLITLLVVKFLVYFLISLRWRRILKELSVNASVGESVSFSFLAIFFTYFLPGNMSSDVAKSFFAARVFGAPGRVVFAIIIDRIVGLVSLLLLLGGGIAVFSLGGSPEFERVWGLVSQAPWQYLLAAMVLGLATATGLWFFVKTHPKFIELKNVVVQLRSPRFWGEVVAYSLLSHFLFGVFLALGASALHMQQVDLLGCLIVFPLATLAMIVPLTPGSLGVGQVLYQYLFDIYAGQPTPASLLFTLLQVSDLIFMVYGAWYFVRLLKLKK